jgi:E3 ubiquitin-protein ligase TRIP12
VVVENSPLDESNSSNLGVTCSTVTTSEAPNIGLCFIVSDHVNSFKDKYFPVDTDSSDIRVTDDLLKVRALCPKLYTIFENVKTKAKEKSKAISTNFLDIPIDVEEQLDKLVSEMLSEISSKLGNSRFGGDVDRIERI